MNIHAPENATTEFPSWEFRGKRFSDRWGSWIRAKHRGAIQGKYYYNFNKNIFMKNKQSISIL